MPEIVVDGYTGLLFDKGDAIGLARAAQQLADNPQLVADMGIHAREAHRAHYTIEKMAERIEAVYKAVGDEKGAKGV